MAIDKGKCFDVMGWTWLLWNRLAQIGSSGKEKV